jgi:hypothetical protein
VRLPWRPLAQRLALFVQLEAYVLKVVHDPPAELSAGIVGDVLPHNVP